MATFRFISVSAALLAACAACLGAEAVTVDGKRVDGTLSGAGAQMRFAGAQTLEISSLARVTYGPFVEPAILVSGVVTRGGDVVRGQVTIERAGAADVASARVGRTSIPADNLAYICLDCAPPAESGRGVKLRNGDFVPAEEIALVPGALKVKGVLGELELPLERVAAVNLAPIARAAAGAEAVLENGDVVRGTLVSASAESVTLEAAFGKVTIPAASLAEVSFPPRLAYLSDLGVEVGSQGLVPPGVSSYGPDQDCNGGPLVSTSRRWRKGLCIRAGASVTVKLPAGARTVSFVPEIAAISAPQQGALTVMVGGKDIWRKPIGEGRGEPVTLDARGATSVSIAFQSEPAGLTGAQVVVGDAFVTIAR